MYQVIVGDIVFSPCHTKELAEYCAKQFYNAKVVETKSFTQPTFTMQHEWELNKLLRAQ